MRSTCESPSSAFKMATFNAKAFEKKLNTMDLSQTSIQTVSLWIIHHRQNIREVIAVWIEMMKKAKMDRKLALLYLANDVVQNSRKKSKELIVYFGKAFKDTFSHLNDKKINNQVERVLKIWDERRVFEKEFLEKLRSVHNSGKKEKVKPDTAKVVEKPTEKAVKPKVPAKPLPDDFKMSTVMNMIVSMKELESELSVQDKQMVSLKVDDLETVKQVKDRSGVNKFVKEFEESKEKLDTYCNKLSRCINEKRVLIDMLHHSESYYEAAYEEAKVIVHAYKTFGSRLASMKRKVESKVKKLKVQWHEKQKEIEEQKSSNPEYELEPISDADEPSDFHADNTDVLDMDLGSDSEVGTPDGPLYDPSSVLYDPNDAVKDVGDNFQPSKEDDDSVSAKIDIPNPEDVLRNIVGKDELSAAAMFQPMGIMIDGKLQTVSLSDGNMIVGTEDRKETSIVQMNTSSSSSISTGVTKSSLIAMEPSGNLLSNEAVSPISEDSVPSPEGTPEGLVLEKDDEMGSLVLGQSTQHQHQSHMPHIFADTHPVQPVMQENQFVGGGQFVMSGNDNWPLATSSAAPLQLVQPALGAVSELPPPPILQSFSGVQPANLNFEPPMQSFIGEQGSLGASFVQVQQNTGLIDQFQMGVGSVSLPQQNLQMQLQIPSNINQTLAVAPTTPTQDESVEPTVRPIDILTQLLNKGRKSKKDSQHSSEKDRTHSDHDKEHRSKDHGKHKKSSRRKSSDRHHSTEHKESSSDRTDSHHSSSKRSHHRRKSRGHSKEKHSSYSDDRIDAKDGSVDAYDDSSLDSYMRSPKISRLQSNESFVDGEESKALLGRGDSVDERSSTVSSDLLADSIESRPITIFDQRRSYNHANKDETVVADKNLSQDGSQQPISTQGPEGLVVSSAESNDPTLNRQHSSGMEIFLPHQNSFEGQIPLKPVDAHLNPPASIANADQWTPAVSTPQKQTEFYFDSRRSPTPEMDHYQADMPINQPQQPHLIPSHFQQPVSFAPASLSQFNSQSGALFSNTNIETQAPMSVTPNVSMEQNVPFPQGMAMQPVGDHSMQQPNFQMGGFEMQPIFNQQQLMQPPRPSFVPEPRMNTNEAMVAVEQQGGMLLAGMDPRFRSAEPPPVSAVHFGTPDTPVQRAVVPQMQPPHSSFQQEGPFFRSDVSPLRQERPFFPQMRPNMHIDRPPLLNDQGGFRHETHSPFAGNQEGFDNQGDQSKQNFISQDFESENQREESANVQQENNKEMSEMDLNFQQGDQQSSSSDSSAVQPSRNVYRNSNAQQNNFSKYHPYPNTNFNEHRDSMLQNDSFHGNNGELNGGHYNHFERDLIRPRFPHPNMPIRNRFRPPRPNLAMRGSRPHRMFRPPGYQQQRSRFRPPMPRPRMPQGFMPRRPVF